MSFDLVRIVCRGNTWVFDSGKYKGKVLVEKSKNELQAIDARETDWIFQGGDYDGKTLDEVAKTVPTYLRWAIRHKVSDAFTDEAFYALEETIEGYGIDIT